MLPFYTLATSTVYTNPRDWIVYGLSLCLGLVSHCQTGFFFFCAWVGKNLYPNTKEKKKQYGHTGLASVYATSLYASMLWKQLLHLDRDFLLGQSGKLRKRRWLELNVLSTALILTKKIFSDSSIVFCFINQCHIGNS